MDGNVCLNCSSLGKLCSELKAEINCLTERLNNLINFVSRTNLTVSCQTVAVETSEICCQTRNTSFTESLCQTESINKCERSCQTDLDSVTPCNQVDGDKPQSSGVLLDISACTIQPNQPFSHFDLGQLNKSVVFDQRLANRSTCYYGSIPYSYGKVIHQSKEMPKSESYLSSILDHVTQVFPTFEFNSVLITKFNNGSDYLGFHSDDEPEILPDSKILTLSFGETRTLVFKSINESGPIQTFFVRHGDAYIMSRESQDIFRHSIPADNSFESRISITLRMLKPVQIEAPPSPINQDISLSLINQFSNLNDATTPVTSASDSTTLHSIPENVTSITPDVSQVLYISDSMFKGINSAKISSPSQMATVLTYPGATAGTMISRLRNDQVFCNLDPTKVTKIFLLCGANSVDQALGVSRNFQEAAIIDNIQISDSALITSKTEFINLIDFLHSWATSSVINILNILPRASMARNQVINIINSYIHELSHQREFVNMIHTEFNRSLFSWKNGFRKNFYFVNRGDDNVHLNRSGVIRLSKYLKYFSHHG